MGFNAIENTPAALRVRWAPSCQIPYHYHPTGALYFIQYGQMFFEGDGPVPDVPINKGEVRWVRPGFAYGPEYNSNTEGTQPSLNTQSCIRRPVCSTLKFENLRSPKKNDF